MALKSIFIKMILVGVIFLSIMNWVIITQTDNDQTNLITNNTLINSSFGELTDNLNAANSQTEIASGTFSNSTPTSTLGFVTITSIVSPTRIFRIFILGTYNILVRLPAQFLGVPEVIISVINSILTLLLILGVWAIWKGGNI